MGGPATPSISASSATAASRSWRGTSWFGSGGPSSTRGEKVAGATTTRCSRPSVGGGRLGSKARTGRNVRRANDDTLFALVDGVVKFEFKDKDRQKVSVYPVAEGAAS